MKRMWIIGMGIMLSIIMYWNMGEAFTYEDMVGTYQGQVCNVRMNTCEPYDYELVSGGIWIAYCIFSITNNTYTYPCFYDMWFVKNNKLFLKINNIEMKCTVYGSQNNGMVCIYDKDYILTGVKDLNTE